MELVNMLAKGVIDNTEAKVVVINHDTLCIGIGTDEVIISSSSNSEEGMSQLTS